MDSCNIVTVVDGMVERVETFTQGDLNDTPNIEKQFLAEVKQRTGTTIFEQISDIDKEALCDNGFAEIHNGSVQIFWEIG